MSVSQSSPSVFDHTSSSHAAYALGVFAASTPAGHGTRMIQVPGGGSPFRDVFFAEEGVSHQKNAKGISLLFSASTCHLAEEKLLEVLTLSKKNSLNTELSQSFFRAIFECLARVSSVKKGHLQIKLRPPIAGLLEVLLSFLAIAPDSQTSEVIIWRSTKALDLLGLIYDPLSEDILAGSQQESPFYRKKNLRRFLQWAYSIAGLNGVSPEKIRVQKLDPAALLPEKQRISDSGYDLTILSEKKRIGSVVLYGTGVIVEPPQGWYFDIVPRSSIIKTGYLLANNVGVIDRAYRGELMIPLLKVDPEAPDLQLPLRIAQLIPRPIVHMQLEHVASLTETARGSGGFGSSGP